MIGFHTKLMVSRSKPQNKQLDSIYFYTTKPTQPNYNK